MNLLILQKPNSIELGFIRTLRFFIVKAKAIAVTFENLINNNSDSSILQVLGYPQYFRKKNMNTDNNILSSETQVIYQDTEVYPTLIEDRIFDRIGLLQKTLLNTKSLGGISLSKEEQEVSIV